MTDSRVKPLGAEIETRTSLLIGLGADDPQAWGKLVRVYGPLVYYWARQRLQASDAEDVGQEVWREIRRSIPGFERRPGAKFRGWLRTITDSKVVTQQRKMAKSPLLLGGLAGVLEQVIDPNLEISDDDAEPDSKVELLVVLRAALNLVQNQVRDEDWQAFLLTTIDGLTAREAAEKLEITPNSVFLARSRIRARLRKVLGRMNFDGDCDEPA